MTLSEGAPKLTLLWQKWVSVTLPIAGRGAEGLEFD